MKKDKTKIIATTISILLKISIVIGVILLLCLWKILEVLNIKFDLLVFLIYPSGILFLMLVYQFIKLFKLLKIENPFSIIMVKYLKETMWISFIIGIIILIALLLSIFVYPTYTIAVKISLTFFTILFIGVGIALYLLSELFKQATEYKEENDLTI